MKIHCFAIPLLAFAACDEPTAVAAAAPEPPPRDEIHGRVLRPDRTPVAGATIQLTRISGLEGREEDSGRLLVRGSPSGEAVATVHSAEDGSFRFRGPLRWNHRLDLTHGDAQEHRFAVPAGDFVEFILGTGCRIEGQLRCEDHEQERFSGVVWLTEDYSGGTRLLAAPISPEGFFHFDSVPPRLYHLLAQVDGHFSYRRMGGVQPVLPGETVRAEISVEEGVEIAGRVLDKRNSAPIAGAQVWIQNGSGPGQLTDQAGRFRFQESRPPSRWSTKADLTANAPGFEQGTTESDLKSECLIRLEPAWPLVKTIRVRLLDAAGMPVAGARVDAFAVARHYEITSGYGQSSVSDAQGEFAIPWPGEPDASLLIRTSDRMEYHLFLGPVAADAPVCEIQLPALTVWNLRLQDDSGNPVAGVDLGRDRTRLFARPPREGEEPATHAAFLETRTTSDSFGRCQFITDGTWPVEAGVFLSWRRHWVLPLQPGGGEQALTLADLRRVPVRVLTADREPAEDFFLVVIDEEHPMEEYGSDQGGTTDPGNLFPSAAGGMAFVEGKFRREVSIVIMGEFMPEHRQEEVALDAGPIEIVLPWTETCTGRVEDATGKAVSGATVFFVDDGKESPCAETGADGTFRVILEKGKFFALIAQDASGRRSEPVGAGTNVSGLVLRIKE